MATIIYDSGYDILETRSRVTPSERERSVEFLDENAHWEFNLIEQLPGGTFSGWLTRTERERRGSETKEAIVRGRFFMGVVPEVYEAILDDSGYRIGEPIEVGRIVLGSLKVPARV